MVGQHIKSRLTTWANRDISGGGILQFHFQGFHRLLKREDLGLKFLNLILEILSGQYVRIGQDFFGVRVKVHRILHSVKADPDEEVIWTVTQVRWKYKICRFRGPNKLDTPV